MSLTPQPGAGKRPTEPLRRRRHRRLQRGLAGLMIVLVVLAGSGATYQALANARDSRANPPPGELVDVGGYRLHLHCTGQGSPTVILEAGGGSISSQWGWVQPEIARTARVCSYDRAGLGWSDNSAGTPDGNRIARDLHTLLQTAEIAAPYVLVGHSAGGLYIRMYAAHYPDEVAGMVLLDSMHPDQFVQMPGTFELMQIPSAYVLLAQLGVVRLSGINQARLQAIALPEADRAAYGAFLEATRTLGSIRAEVNAFPATMDQVRATPGLDDLPLVVVSAGQTAEQFLQWDALQADLVRLSANSAHQRLTEATHFSLVSDPDHAHITSMAIRDVVEAVQQQRRSTR